MKTRTKLIAIILTVLFATTPFLASASTGSSTLGFFGSLFSTIQSGFNTVFDFFSGSQNTATLPASSTIGGNYITIKLGSKSVIVTVLQKELVRKGYLKEAPSGIFDANTQAAVEAIQKAQNLPVTGYILVATSSLSAIFSQAASTFTPITVGATGTRATALQKVLITRGSLNIATATAYFGATTQAAVKTFQAAHDLPQTGIIDKATFAAMNGG
jgi:peptidoglycan hydrolase-like protein with peptidoglycan-binding domain